MLATAFWKAVTMDRSEFLDRLIALLDAEGIRYCIVGGQAVNAYASYVERAAPREVLGIRLPVAAIEDVLQGKIRAASDPARRPSKRLKDLADIARLLEVSSQLRPLVPGEILVKIVWSVFHDHGSLPGPPFS